MKHHIAFLIMSLLISGCTIVQVEDKTNEIVTSKATQMYHEVETALTSEIVEDIVDFSSIVPKEIVRLQKKGYRLGYDQNHKIQGRALMHILQYKMCGKEDCPIATLQAYEHNLPPEFKVSTCDEDNWCIIVDPKFPGVLEKSRKELIEFYGFGREIYAIRRTNDRDHYSIYKNEQEIFSHQMFFGSESVIEEASIVQESPAFTFYDINGWNDVNTPIVSRNIWYKGETLNEKYLMDTSSHLFSYKEKEGFVGEKDSKKFIFFNGQKISKDFDEIRTKGCCALSAYPIEIDKNGILFFLAKREEKYFFVEINLNEYVK